MGLRGRRKFLIALGGTLAAPSLTWAEQNTRIGKNPARVGILWSGSEKATVQFRKAVFEGLAALGWVEGRNLIVDARYADGKLELHEPMAKELIALVPDVILAPANQGAMAAHKLTTTVPIVFVLAHDPIVVGLAQELARPGGNVTGLLSVSSGYDFAVKRLSLLRETFPSSKRIAILQDSSGDPVRRTQESYLVRAAETMGLALERIELTSSAGLDGAFSALARMRPDAVLVYATPWTFTHRREIVLRVNAARFGAMFSMPPFVAAGGLMSYSPSFVDLFRRSAGFVDRILRGANPADMPIEQPTQFEFVVNLKTAKALGITLPTSVMLRASRVIE